MGKLLENFNKVTFGSLAICRTSTKISFLEVYFQEFVYSEALAKVDFISTRILLYTLLINIHFFFGGVGWVERGGVK